MNPRLPSPVRFLRRVLTPALVALALLASASCSKQADKTQAKGPQKGYESVDQRVSYGIGYNLGSNLKRQEGVSVDRAALMAGIEDALGGEKPRLDEKEVQAAFAEVETRVKAALEAAAKTNLETANRFLDQNKGKLGVKTTASGLQYEVLKVGTGAKPRLTDRVEVHYHGTLTDGTVFDSSVERKQPIQLAVNGVIPGWTEALQLMPVGSKWRLTIPPALAYGPRATGKIPPNSALVFEVELLGIK